MATGDASGEAPRPARPRTWAKGRARTWLETRQQTSPVCPTPTLAPAGGQPAVGLAGAVTGALGAAPSVLSGRPRLLGAPRPGGSGRSRTVPQLLVLQRRPLASVSPRPRRLPPSLPSLPVPPPPGLVPPHSLFVPAHSPRSDSGPFHLLRYPVASARRLPSLGLTLAEGFPRHSWGPSGCRS